ncbi:GTP-binding protein [Chitinivorax sp. B]|uniref:CobW family GTP-binding protein n=1 Tax=Chitinivorax sp. B TaxID=2502235 RepID=UPI0010F83A57|nr:GTP-binding protein [Chitinivorax sp. B]
MTQSATNKRIPVNLITGFLGSGKTTLIRHLLHQCPPDEHWAVLVNEFGKIGIDGALLAQPGISIKQVPGGCICCVSSPMFRTGLNNLIRQAKPDRILIEPSGLAHPAAIQTMLQDASYRQTLQLGATLALIDPTSLRDGRIYHHPLLKDQLNAADFIIASKTDQATEDDWIVLQHYLATMQPPRQISTAIQHGRLDIVWLDKPGNLPFPRPAPSSPHRPTIAPAPQKAGYGMHHQRSADGIALGWRWPPARQFDLSTMLAWLDTQFALGCLRAKGILHTNEGWIAINHTARERHQTTSEWQQDSRLELIYPPDHSIDIEQLETTLAQI